MRANEYALAQNPEGRNCRLVSSGDKGAMSLVSLGEAVRAMQ